MRPCLVIAIAVLALCAPASALAGSPATADVTISPAGYSPTQPVVAVGGTVTFHNNEALGPDNVQFSDETTPRCSNSLATDCSRKFDTAGQYQFFDSGHPCTEYGTCPDPYRGIVIVDGPPSVTGLSGPGSALRGQDVNFAGSGSDPNGDTIALYNWDFGDGQTLHTGDPSATHNYPTAGNYTVTLTVTDSRGNESAPMQIGIAITVPDSDGDGFDDDHDSCPSVPGVAPNGCPPAPPVVIPPAIASAATAAKTLSVKGSLKSGVPVVVSCSAACLAQVTLLPASLAAQLPVPYASATLTIPQGGSQLVTLMFTPSAKRTLAKRKNLKLTLQVLVTDALGRTQTRTSSIRLMPVQTVGKLPAIGISDENAATFADPLFQVLKLKFARLVTPWNGIFKEPARLDQWLQAARAQGVRPLVSFEHARGDLCPKRPCKAPSVRQYKRAWLAFHRKYPWVRDISPWNEANSSTQPTGRRPDLAAAYYNTVRASCRGCTIVAADVLDLNNMRRYLYAFLAKAKGKPRLWGLHNYRDTNRFRETGTRQLLATVKGTVWFTETGGIVKFTTQGGKKALPTSESRARRAMAFMFRLAELDAKRVKRIYVYQWMVNFKGDRFDAGVVRPDGTPRPSFDVLTLNASIARKR